MPPKSRRIKSYCRPRTSSTSGLRQRKDRVAVAVARPAQAVELREHVMRQPNEPIPFVSRLFSTPTPTLPGSVAVMALNTAGEGDPNHAADIGIDRAGRQIGPRV